MAYKVIHLRFYRKISMRSTCAKVWVIRTCTEATEDVRRAQYKIQKYTTKLPLTIPIL